MALTSIISMLTLGAILSNAPDAGSPPQGPPQSSLPLMLAGVALDTTSPERSAALIECGSSTNVSHGSLLRVGERACDVAVVEEIVEGRVIVRNLLTNALESLAFKTPDGRASSAPDAPQRPPIEVTSSKDGVTVTMGKDAVTHYRANLSEVLRSAKAAPHYARDGNGNWSIDGFEITELQPGGLVDAVGLQIHDVVVEVNGQSLRDVATAVSLAGVALLQSDTTIAVLRNGQKIRFRFTRP